MELENLPQAVMSRLGQGERVLWSDLRLAAAIERDGRLTAEEFLAKHFDLLDWQFVRPGTPTEGGGGLPLSGTSSRQGPVLPDRAGSRRRRSARIVSMDPLALLVGIPSAIMLGTIVWGVVGVFLDGRREARMSPEERERIRAHEAAESRRRLEQVRRRRVG